MVVIILSLLERKNARLKNSYYNQTGAFFITICVKNRKKILSKIDVGTLVSECPKIKLTRYGQIANRYINQLNDFYDNISVDKYVIMPDHIHLLITISDDSNKQPRTSQETQINNRNSIVQKERTTIVARFVGTFKRFCNREFGDNIWQSRFYDHIIRNEMDYREVCEYIESNPYKWVEKQKNMNVL